MLDGLCKSKRWCFGGHAGAEIADLRRAARHHWYADATAVHISLCTVFLTHSLRTR